MERACLLALGTAALAGGRPVHEVESELVRVGAALGVADVRCAATPTGLFVAIGEGDTGFRPVGPPLRFDQAAALSAVRERVLAHELGPAEAIAAVDAVIRQPPRIPRLVAAAGLLPVGAGLALILQPAPANVLFALLCSVLVAALIELAGRSPLLTTLLPVVAAFSVGCIIFAAAEGDLLEGPLRTLLPPIAVLLPGALIVTGMSELAAGAMVAGTARLVFGTVQLLLFTFGVLAAARVVGTETAELANVRVDELGPWAAWAGLALVGVGVFLNVSAPRGALPWMLGLLALTFLAQTGGQEAYGAPVGAFLGGLVAALGAAVVGRFDGPPTLVVFLPSFWLLVPGSLGLVSVTQLAAASGGGFETATAAAGVIVAIALGVLTGSALGRAVHARG